MRGWRTRAAFLADSVAHAGCDAVIGPLVPGLIRASASSIGEHGIVQILPLARRGDFTTLAQTLFQMSVAPARQGAYLARYAAESEGMELLATLVMSLRRRLSANRAGCRVRVTSAVANDLFFST